MAQKKVKPKARKGKVKKAKTPAQIKRRSIIITAFWCLVVMGLIVGCAVAGYVIHDMVTVVNGDKVIDLNVYKENQDQTTIIYAYADDENKKLIELKSLHGAENRIWVDIEKIPQDFQDAFICLEDKRFLTHHGVDWYRVASVISKGGSQGGSTITQQLIKNLTQENKRTFVRKYREIEYALNLEKNYKKNEILEAYMNTIYFSHGCYGVYTAAEYYFGKDVSDLSLAECACIAAITQYPSANDPTIHPEDNYSRAKVCLYAMLEQGCISRKEYDDARAEIEKGLTFTEGKKKISEDEKQKEQEEQVNSYYVDYVIDSVIEDLVEKYDYTYQQATRMIYSGGLRIYSAVDMKVQDQMEKVYESRDGFADDEVQSSMTVMDYEGRVCGIIGGAGKKTENRSLNRAVDSPRQPGSSIKPMSVYSVAIENNEVTWSTMLPNYGIMTLGGSIWPKNQGGITGSPDQLIPVQKGIARSLNTISAQTLKRVGVHTAFEWLVNNMHISTAVTEGDLSDEGYSQLATGSMSYGITTLEMAAAYATFGNGGVYYKPYCYYKVTDSTGKKIILQHEDEGEQVMSGDTAEIMCKLLQTVTTDPSGTGGPYAIAGFRTMGKTGTTTDSYDRWFAGGTPYYVASVWYGYDKNREVTDYGNPAGRLFREVLNPIHENLDRSKTYVTSNTVVSRSYCLTTGGLATDTCKETAVGWYSVSNLPKPCPGCKTKEEEEEESKKKEKDKKTTKKSDKDKTTTKKSDKDKTTEKETTTKETTTKETTTKETTTKETTTKDPNLIDEWEDDEG